MTVHKNCVRLVNDSCTAEGAIQISGDVWSTMVETMVKTMVNDVDVWSTTVAQRRSQVIIANKQTTNKQINKQTKTNKQKQINNDTSEGAFQISGDR